MKNFEIEHICSLKQFCKEFPCERIKEKKNIQRKKTYEEHFFNASDDCEVL